MTQDQRRGLAAVVAAIGAITTILWLAIARLSPVTAFGIGGVSVAALAVICTLSAVIYLRRKKR